MTRYLQKMGRGAVVLMTLIAAIGLGVYYYPYLSARICWSGKSWTSDEDFMEALFKIEHPEIIADPIVEREGADLLRAGTGDVRVLAVKPKLNHPASMPWGDTYPGFIYLEKVWPEADKVYFFNNCAKFAGVLQ